MVSDAETESIFMEPIHLSSAVAAKQIINEGDAIRWVGGGRVQGSSGDSRRGVIGRCQCASHTLPITLRGADPKKAVPPSPPHQHSWDRGGNYYASVCTVL